ncbi:MAG: type I methionyl aminopeptidase [Patescibacteria group bacterium]
MNDMIKTAEEISVLREGGALLSRALAAAVAAVRPGVTTSELDQIATRVIREGGGEPSFLGYKTHTKDLPFPTTLCTSINHEVVHAPAVPARVLVDGDIIGLDIGARYRGFCTDMAVTVAVGDVGKDLRTLMQVTHESLLRGLEQVKPGNMISDIGKAVQTHVEKYGYGVVRDLVGHGVGRGVHEDPRIPNYFDPFLKPVRIVPGMVLCIEPMITLGDYAVDTSPDDWTIVTVDGSPAAHFEVTVVVTETGNDIITPLPL